MFESTRQYARERLAERGEEEAAAREHACALLAVAEKLDELYENMSDRALDMEVEPEMENWRAALAWALGERGDRTIGQRLAGAKVWVRSAPAEARKWVRLATQTIDATTDDAIVAALDLAEALLDATLNQVRALQAAADRALARYRHLGDERGVVAAQRCAGVALVLLNRAPEGEVLLQSALDAARVLGLQRTVAATLGNLAVARSRAGDPDGARKRYAEAQALAEAAGLDRMLAVSAINRAEVEFRYGDTTTALRLCREALEMARNLNETGLVANDLQTSAAYLIALRRFDEARTAVREAMALCRDLQFEAYLALTHQHLAAIAGLRPCEDAARAHDERIRSAMLLGYADARLDALGTTRGYTDQQEYDKLAEALRDALGADRLQRLMDDGGTWSEDRGFTEALLV